MDVHSISIGTHTGNIDMYHKERQCLDAPSPVNDDIKSNGEVVALRVATHNVMSAVDIPCEMHTALDSSSISILSQHHLLHIIGQQESGLPSKEKLSSFFVNTCLRYNRQAWAWLLDLGISVGAIPAIPR